jgi:hypothetical protein
MRRHRYGVGLPLSTLEYDYSFERWINLNHIPETYAAADMAKTLPSLGHFPVTKHSVSRLPLARAETTGTNKVMRWLTRTNEANVSGSSMETSQAGFGTETPQFLLSTYQPSPDHRP